MSENQRFPIGRTLTEFGDSLSTEEWENPSGAGEWREVEVTGGFIQEAADYTEELQEYLNQMRGKVIGTFDVAISAMTLFNDFMFLMPNFMNAVMTYIAQLVSNALEAYLRLGMHILVVPPDFGDAKYQGFPTTDLHAQAENVHKKFYDSSDPYLPYNVPFQKNLAEQMIESGAKVENKIEKFMLKKDLDGTSLSKKMLGIEKNETLKSDFIDFNQSIENLSRPIGFYDAIFLYFSISYNSNTNDIRKFVESIASLANLFQLESLTGLHNDFDNVLFRSTKSKISILTNQQMRGLPKSTNQKYEKVDSYTKKQIRVDKELTDIIIIEADPIENMPQQRLDRLKKFVENEIEETQKILQTYSSFDYGGFETRAESEINQIEETLKNNSRLLKTKHKELKIKQQKGSFYRIRYELSEFFNSFNWDASDQKIDQVLRKFEKDYSHISQTIKEHSGGNSEFEKIDQLFTMIQNHNNDIGEIDKAQVGELRNQIGTSWIEPSDALSISTPTEMYQSYNDDAETLQEDIIKIEKMIREEAERIHEEKINDLTDSVKSKSEKIKNLEKRIHEGSARNLSPENTTQIIQHHRNYKVSNRGLYQNHLDTFYEREDRTIVDYAKQAWGLTVGEPIPSDVSVENFVYEFSIRRPATSLQKIQTGMYVHIYQKEKPYDSDYKFLGDGFVTDEHAISLQEGGDGSWIGVNFSDLVGSTATIKTLQKKVNSFANMFTPNNTFLTEMIRTLREIRERILEMIDIIDNLLTILNLSIKFEGKVWGKYCREADLDGYDKLASDLTNTVGFINPLPKRDFRPSQNNKIANLLRKIERIDPLAAEQIRVDIDTQYQQTDDYQRRKEIAEQSQYPTLIPKDSETTYSSPSVWDAYGLTYDVLEQAEKTKSQVSEELNNIYSTANNLVLGLGSSLFENIENMDFVDEKTVTINRQQNKIKLWKSEIYAELGKIEPTLSNEFGFSMVFLSYLPKNQPFYPVRYLAEMWGLVDEDGAPITTDRMKPLDPSLIDHLMYPPKTQSFLESLMTQMTIDQNPSNVITGKPDPIDVSFVGHRVASQTNFNWFIRESTSSDYFEVISASPDYRFRIKQPLRKSLHGVRVNQTLELPDIYGPITESFTYRFEATIAVEFDSAYKGTLSIDEIPKLNKLEIHMGVFLVTKESYVINLIGGGTVTAPTNLYSSHESTFSLMVDNGSDVSVHKFGSRKKKKFITQLVGVQKNQIQRFQPYILIGNVEEEIDMKSLIFTIEKSQIYFYRSR